MDNATTRHDASAEAALEAVRSHEGPVLLDLDETVYLRNSTEDFINSVRPSILAFLLVRLLTTLKPWRWTGGARTKDAWRVRLIVTVFPWSLAVWRRAARRLAGDHANRPLIGAAVTRASPPILVTDGFLPIAAPLAAELGLAQSPLVAPRVWNFDDRRRGKLRLAIEALGMKTVAESLFVTDSSDDLSLLDACARPFRTVWPEAQYRPAFASVYCPGLYISRVKRPNERYISRNILQDDFAIWFLCSVFLAASPLLHTLGLLLLLVSFWAVYEQGYVDNDRIASRFEADPRLSAAHGTVEVPTPALAPWLWALAFGAVALMLLRWPAAPSLTDLAVWVAVLAATSLWFRLYNRLDKPTRTWLFSGLQLARSASFAVVVPVAAIAPIAIGANVLARSVPYLFYRRGLVWPELKVKLLRLHFLVILGLLFVVCQDFALVSQWPTLALLAFYAFKARRDFAAVLAAATRIDRGERGSAVKDLAVALGSTALLSYGGAYLVA